MNNIPGLPAPLEAETAEFDGLSLLKGIYTLQHSKKGSAPVYWNIYLPGFNKAQAVERCKKFCSDHGYTFIWVRPFIQDIEILERSSNNVPIGKAYPIPGEPIPIMQPNS